MLLPLTGTGFPSSVTLWFYQWRLPGGVSRIFLSPRLKSELEVHRTQSCSFLDMDQAVWPSSLCLSVHLIQLAPWRARHRVPDPAPRALCLAECQGHRRAQDPPVDTRERPRRAQPCTRPLGLHCSALFERVSHQGKEQVTQEGQWQMSLSCSSGSGGSMAPPPR